MTGLTVLVFQDDQAEETQNENSKEDKSEQEVHGVPFPDVIDQSGENLRHDCIEIDSKG